MFGFLITLFLFKGVLNAASQTILRTALSFALRDLGFSLVSASPGVIGFRVMISTVIFAPHIH